MPSALKKFLKSLDRKTANRVWLWLDGNPRAIEQMIELVADPSSFLHKEIRNIEEKKPLKPLEN